MFKSRRLVKQVPRPSQLYTRIPIPANSRRQTSLSSQTPLLLRNTKVRQFDLNAMDLRVTHIHRVET